MIRHGETACNEKGAYYGKLDVPLNEKGVKQIKKIGTTLNKIAFDSVYSSNTTRTLDSLKLCGENLYERASLDQRIAEIDFGEFEGKTYKEITALYPQHMDEWHDNWQDFCPPGGESFIDFYRRVTSFFKELLTVKADHVLVMTHSGVIKAIYCYVLNNNPDLYWHFTCHNGTINKIKYEHGNLFIDGMNKEGE